MKIFSKVAILLGSLGVVLILAGCHTSGVSRSTSYSSTVVTPVSPYYMSTMTSYRTRVYKKRYCVGQTYYYKKFCPNGWRKYGYRSCSPKRYYCW